MGLGGWVAGANGLTSASTGVGVEVGAELGNFGLIARFRNCEILTNFHKNAYI